MPARKVLESKNEYTIGWIAALAIERAAATALLDEEHDAPKDFEQNPADHNAYTWGRIYKHNIVIASLPAGGYGLTNATKTVLGLVVSLPHIRIGLLVGIGAGIPESGIDIRLGDIAVSRPEGTTGGVIQYDTGKVKNSGWERTGMLASPPEVLLHALGKLQADHELHESQISAILSQAASHNDKFATNYGHPGVDKDYSYESATGQDQDLQVKSSRMKRTNTQPYIHYGTIASGNLLVKDAETRMDIFKSLGHSCICLEMEAAGLMSSFPCLVIRGICDYADSHKNDIWQRYASATAAAFAKELLGHVPRASIEKTQSLEQLMGQLQVSLDVLNNGSVYQSERSGQEERISKLLQSLYTCPYVERKDRNIRKVRGTCEWFTSHLSYTRWRRQLSPSLLWVSADPGCGKSVLMRHLVDEAIEESNKVVCYFFFKDDFGEQRSAASAACSLLRQLLLSGQVKNFDRVLKNHSYGGSQYINSFTNVWADFIATSLECQKDVVCYIDALDECQDIDRLQMISSLCKLYDGSNPEARIKVLATSRPYHNIIHEFRRWRIHVPIIHLDGDSEKEKEAISKEINIVIDYRIKEFGITRNLSPEEVHYLMKRFMLIPHRTYLWAHLTLNWLEESPAFTRDNEEHVASELPQSVDDAYESILNRSTDPAKAKLILNLIVGALEPFTIKEMSILLTLTGPTFGTNHQQTALEHPERLRETMRQLCGMFITIVGSKIYLLHQTAREFLVRKATEPMSVTHTVHTETRSLPIVGAIRWKQSILLNEAHYKLAERCLWWLLVSDAPGISFSLYEYSAAFWIEHFEEAMINPKDPLIAQALACLDVSSGNLQRWYEDGQHRRYHTTSYLRTRRLDSYDCPVLALAQRPLALPSYLGISALVQHLLKASKWNTKNLSSALWFAVRGGSNTSAQVLLENGARTDVIADGGPCDSTMRRRSALTLPWLSYNSRVSKIKQRFSNLGFDEMYVGNTPLNMAIENDDEASVRMLLRTGIAWHSEVGGPLHAAIPRSNPSIIEMLVNQGVSRDLTDGDGRTPMVKFFRTGVHHDCSVIHQLLWTENSLTPLPESLRSLEYLVKFGCKECEQFLRDKGIS